MSAPLWVLAEPIDGLVLTLYYLLLGVLSFYGVHRLVLLAAQPRPQRTSDASPSLAAEGTCLRIDSATELPFVTVQLPLFNEPHVAGRLITAVSAFDYPAHRFEIQVLDDSTDGTGQEVARAVVAARSAGLSIHHLRRERRHGYKAGALAAGLGEARGELIAIFDADFLPKPDFLVRCVGFFDDPEIGMVQARWAHLNRHQSLLTRLQAILLDGHFLVEHQARHDLGCMFNFNGTAGIWRREAITSAGGWQHDTLTEDLDLSYRSQLAGWKFLFCPELAVPAELPGTVDAFRIQQSRWTRGSTQTLRKLWRRLAGATVPWRVRAEAFVHLTSNLAYPLLVALALLMPWASLARHRSGLETLVAVDVVFFLLASGALACFYAVAQRRAGRSASAALALHPAVMALGIGMSVYNAAAALRGLWVRGGEFQRTPKWGERDAGELAVAAAPDADARASGQVLRPRIDRWRRERVSLSQPSHDMPKVQRSAVDLALWASFALGVYLAWGAVLAGSLGAWWFVPFEALFSVGYLSIAVAQLWSPRLARALPMPQAWRLRRAWRTNPEAWHASRLEVEQVDDSVA